MLISHIYWGEMLRVILKPSGLLYNAAEPIVNLPLALGPVPHTVRQSDNH